MWHRNQAASPGRGKRREDRPMKARILRLIAVIGAVAAVALAGGASLNGF